MRIYAFDLKSICPRRFAWIVRQCLTIQISTFYVRIRAETPVAVLTWLRGSYCYQVQSYSRTRFSGG